MEDLSDDVSALSMDGASTIGKNVAFTKRLQMKLDILGTIEDAAENDVDVAAAAAPTSTGDLIEPFPKTYEEWKEKKEMKKKHKHKSSKKSHKKSRKKDKGREDTVDTSSSNNLPPIPIMEIAIKTSAATAATPLSPARSNMSTSRKSKRSTGGSGVYSHSHNSITSSTDSSTGHFSRPSSSILSSGHGGGRPSSRRSHPHPHRCSELSESQTSYTSHQSHITIEKINRIKSDLEKAISDEKQVLEIHHQLEMEVTKLEMNSQQFHERRQQIHHDLEVASSERYQLQCALAELHAENDKLRAKLRKAEDKEDKKRLDDVLDSMESKMRALKLQSKRAKEKKRRSDVEGNG